MGVSSSGDRVPEGATQSGDFAKGDAPKLGRSGATHTTVTKSESSLRSKLNAAQWLLEGIAKGAIIVGMLLSMFVVGVKADPGVKAAVADRILSWSFVVFSVGLAELFVLFVLLAVMGKVDLAQAFQDKQDNQQDKQGAASGRSKAPVSLARLQAFLWTLVVMTVYFHRVVKSEGGDLPTIPPELLMVMGISSAVYLASKGITSNKPNDAADRKG